MPQARDLIPIVDLAVARTTRHPREELPRFSDDSIIFDTPPGHLPRGLEVERAEMADRLHRSAESRTMLSAGPSDPVDFASLSRYAAEVAVSSRDAAELQWLPDLVRKADLEDWRTLLSGPSAAPVLRGVLRHSTGMLDWPKLAERIDRALAGHAGILFDVDTAAGVALLAFRGGNTALCSRTLDEIISAARQESWRLMDIPAELWGDLADLFTSYAPEVTQRRQVFAELLFREKPTRRRRFPFVRGAMEVWINALRIGAPGETIRSLVEELDQVLELDGNYGRRLFMLLVRCAREGSDREAVRDLFSQGAGPGYLWKRAFGVPHDQSLESVNVEAISMLLSYREAMDLRWGLKIVLQAPPDQTTNSRHSRPPRRSPDY